MPGTLFLENQRVKASFTTTGAELCSLINKANNREYLWQGNPEVWPRHAPVLFPIVGKLKENRYEMDGRSYHLSQHGFARDMDFQLIQQSSDGLKFALTSNNETLQHFPFKFQFFITYQLLEDGLSVTYEVNNRDHRIMPFSVGAHPGFSCPLMENERFEDYYLEFDQSETLERHLLTDGVFNGEAEVVLENSAILALSYRYFEKDAIVFKDVSSNTVYLKSSRSKHGVKMSFEDFPYLGIWTKEKGAPFICIEPWYGLADHHKTSGNILEKEGIITLEPGEEFGCKYQIQIF